MCELELSGIAIFYAMCFAVGFLMALVMAIFGEIGAHGGLSIGEHDVGLDHSAEVGGHDLDLGGHDLDAGHDAGGHVIGVSEGSAQMPQASFLNGLTLLVLLGTFGLAGLFAVWVMELSPALSLLFAAPMGVLGAALEFVLYVKVFIRAQASSEATMSDTLGCEAEVITTIPADRVGEIAYVIKGTRYTAPAISADGEELARGARVHIVNIRGTTLVVRAFL